MGQQKMKQVEIPVLVVKLGRENMISCEPTNENNGRTRSVSLGSHTIISILWDKM